jgi:alpha-mannosidase
VHDDRRLVEGRIDRVLHERIAPAVYSATTPMRLSGWRVPGEPVSIRDAAAATYDPIAIGDVWGTPWSTLWIRAEGVVPSEWAGCRVEALFDLGFAGDWPGFQAEALVYDALGSPLKGIHPGNRYVPVVSTAAGGEQVTFLVEAAANPDVLGQGFVPTDVGDRLTADDTPLFQLRRADLAIRNDDVWQLQTDLQVLSELMHALSTDDPRRHEILRTLERALDCLDTNDIAATARAARAVVAVALERPANASAHVVSAIGHAHIDTAWLWPQRETKRKVARTFSNVTALAEEYPELIFACSQAQQYVWIKEEYPELYQRIQRAVAKGQWIPAGGMWVEADGNLPGGESLARQLVVGKRFFLDEFGYDCPGVWLPDSFGYTAAFPQLARLAGMRWFLTQKISWNQTNRFPHHTFWWEGLDGTRIFTHFPPADTYNGTLTGHELAHTVRNFADKGGGTRSLLPFGHGDGGGGPTREMLQRARRLRDLEGSARVVIEDPDAFFRAAQAEYPNAPVWSGELYLELHRATFTTQANTKANNRRCEHLLREAELWSVAASLRSGATYPYEQLDRLWKTVLLHQFHDILPGSSIAWVYREAEAAYLAARNELEQIIARAVEALAHGDGGTEEPWVFNPSPGSRAEVVSAPGTVARRTTGQVLADGTVAVFARVPAAAGAPLAVAGSAPPAEVETTETTVDNGLLRIEVNGQGLLTSIRDLIADREVLAPDAVGNVLQMHPDLPNTWDAWDIDRHYLRRHVDVTQCDSLAVLEAGPLVGAIRVERSFGSSTVSQTVRLTAGSRRLELDLDLDWHETEQILKLAFPFDIHADRSSAEIQFGHVHRPTHDNTSWDAARFELYCHRFVHLAEAGYGVALVNEATYGYDARRHTRVDGGTTTTVRMSVVRAPRSPDPRADRGRHRRRFALIPGATVADAVAAGYAMNLPLRITSGRGGVLQRPLVDMDGPAAVVEAVKLADDRSGDIVVRLYESLGGRTRSVLRTSFPVAEAGIVDLLERATGETLVVDATGDGAAIPIILRPFQVLSLRLRRALTRPGRT